ncbi:hypothetical protein R80B4_01828 [Fibrobacteres bacterium R8-0-B4]
MASTMLFRWITRKKVIERSRNDLTLLLLTLTLTASASASTAITASVSADSAMVGDELLLDVVITGVPKGAKIIPPDTDKGFGEFSVLGWEDVSAGSADNANNRKDKGKDKDKDNVRDSSRYQYRYNIATYKPENCTIPSIRFLVGNDGVGTKGINTDNNGIGTDNSGIDTNSINAASAGFSINPANPSTGTAGYDTLSTAPIPIRMLSALPPEPPDSDGFAIKDLKGQQGAGKADLWYLWIVLGIVLIIVLWILMRKYLKKKSENTAAPAVPLLPPYEEAVGAIEALERKNYVQRGLVREYVFELSEIFKRYIGRRYDTIAPELTTEEIAAWLEFSEISREMRLCAERFFRSSDQVKFAKWVPDRQCIEGYVKDVRTFIEATKPDTTLPYERKTERMGAAQ